MNTENLDNFIRDVRNAHIRAVELRDYDENSVHEKSDLLTTALNELIDTIEELQVADVELRAQQDELAESQNELVKQRQYFQELFNFAPDAYIVTDNLGTILDANQAASLLFNRKQEVLPGKPLSVFIGLNSRAEFRNRLGQLRSTRAPLLWETDILPTRLSPVKVSISARPITQSSGMGQRFCWIICKSDELRGRAEQEQEAEARRVQWMGIISHELRTPLTSIKGFVSSLLAKDVTFDAETQREFLEVVDTETDKLTELVAQLLEFSRVQSGTLRITPSEQPLSDVMTVAQTGLESLAQKHNLKIDVSESLPDVWADSQRISQVLLNLVDNAVKYAPPGSTISIRACRVEEIVQVDVSNQGEGIPPEDRQHVFEAYHQTTRKSQKNGTGLGLAICKGIVEAHGGMIWIQDRAAPGTTVSFTLAVVDEVEE